MKFNSILTLCLILILFFSCSAPKFVTSYEEYPKISLDLKAELIIVDDKRKNVSISDDLKLPFISHPGQYDISIPPLKNEYTYIIKQTILENLSSASSNSAILTVQILNARKEFTATFWSEKETSFVKLKILAKIDGKEIEVTESCEYSKKSIDAKYKRSERIFKNAIKEVTYKALKKLINKMSG